MLKGDSKMRTYRFKLTLEAKKVFKELYNTFKSLLVVRHFNLEKRIKIIIDILKVGRRDILLQLGSNIDPIRTWVSSNSELTRNQVYWHLVAFLS